MEPSPRRAALYLRASTDHQKYSTANQEACLRAYADAHGMSVTKTYEDDGQSGLSLKGRIGLVQLLKDVLQPSPGFEVLLVYDISRWGRFQDADEGAYYEHICKRAGVRVIYGAEPFENDNSPMANVVKAIKRAMAAEYSRELSVKVSVGQLRLAACGYCQGGRANYGLGRLLIDPQGNPKGLLTRGNRKNLQTDRVMIVPGPPDEMAVVRRIYHLFTQEGLGELTIAKRLEAEGIPGPTGRGWWGPTVRNILKNEKYCGTFVYNRTTLKLAQPRRRNPPEMWVRKQNALDGVVAKEQFDQAQAIFGQRLAPRSKEQMLKELRALYEREGRLSKRLIDSEDGMLSTKAYESRFVRITDAYVLVGYVSPECANLKWWNDRTYRREDLLVRLRGLLARKGEVTRTLIEDEPNFPSRSCYQRAFGSLTNAYSLIGFEGVRPGLRPKARDISDK